MEILLTIFSIGVGAAAFFASLVAIALGLTGGDVAKTLGLIEAQELPEIKRKTARCLMLLTAWGSLFFAATIPVILSTAAHIGDEQGPDAPWWFTIWMLIGMATAYYVVSLVALLFRFAGLLRDQDVLAFRDSRYLLWSSIVSAFHRAKPND